MTSGIGSSRSVGEDSTKKEPLSDGGKTFEDFADFFIPGGFS